MIPSQEGILSALHWDIQFLYFELLQLVVPVVVAKYEQESFALWQTDADLVDTSFASSQRCSWLSGALHKTWIELIH